MDLTEITQFHQKVHELIVQNQGEITPEIEELLKISEEELEKKLVGYYFAIENLESDAEVFKKESDKYLRISRGLNNTIDRLKQNLQVSFDILGKEELRAGFIKLRYVKGKSRVVIDDVTKLPLEFKETKVIPQLNKIYEYAKLSSVPGAHLEETKYLKFDTAKENR